MATRLATLTALLAALVLGSCGDPAATVTVTTDTPPAGATKARHPDEVRGDKPFAYKPGPEGAAPVRGGTAVLGLLSDIDSFNPFTSTSYEASEVHDLIFPRLMVENPDYYNGPPTFSPNIAEKWTPGADGLSIRFTLRDCTWSDGRPISGEDVLFSLQAAKSKEVAWVSSSIADSIQDIEVHSTREFTVKYTTKSPYQVMDINDIQILPKHVFGEIPFERWQSHGLWEEQCRVAGGPFKLAQYRPNQQIVLERNPTYWDEGKPYLDAVVFRIVGDMKTQVNAVLAGDLDLIQSVTPQDTGRVLEAKHLNLYSFVGRGFDQVGWNVGDPLFADRRVRQALTHAIDRENILESVLYGYGKIGSTHILSSFWASNNSIEPRAYDPDRAIALLEEAGWTRNADGIFEKDGKPFEFALWYNSGNERRKQVSEYVQSNLREIGVKAVIEVKDFNQMSEQLKKHKFQAYIGGLYEATKVDPTPKFHSRGADGRFNFSDYKNPRVDEIIDTARFMSDFKEAKKLWDEFQEILHEDQPTTMLYEMRGLVALHKRFQNVRVTALRALHNVDEWWVPADQRKYKTPPIAGASE